MASNKTLIYKKLPTGLPVPGEHLAIENRPIDLDHAPEGGLLVEIQAASFDPYLRGKMRDPNTKSYSPPFEIDAPITNGTLGKVLKSNSPDYEIGDLVIAHLPIAEYSYVPEALLKTPHIRKVHNPYDLDTTLFLGPLGMPGLTAWSGLHKIGQPKKGETIFISSAAGAVGQIVGQVAKREGLTVIGSVGSDEKLDFIIKELGFDAGFNYKKEKPKVALPRLAPEGIDIYWENVGGEHLEAALENLKVGGRIPVCGMVSSASCIPKNMANTFSDRSIQHSPRPAQGRERVDEPDLEAGHHGRFPGWQPQVRCRLLQGAPGEFAEVAIRRKRQGQASHYRRH